MGKIKVEIWSDIACPYCYIGKRKFEKALEQFPQSNEVEVVWHSYELNPNQPKIDSLSEEQKKLSGKSGNHLETLAAEVGLDYNLNHVVHTNTSDALRLVKLAKEKGLADQAEEILFKAYFTEGKSVSNRQVLLESGEAIGLDKKDVEAMLDSDRYLKEIKSDMAYSENVLHLEYIPFYLINDKITIEGSLSVEEYLKALESAANDEDANFSGKSCSIDGVCS